MTAVVLLQNLHTRQENENVVFGKGKASQAQMTNKSNRLALGTLNNQMNVHGARSRLVSLNTIYEHHLACPNC